MGLQNTDFLSNLIGSTKPLAMKAARQLTIAMLLVVVITALYVGIYMIVDPSGTSLHLPPYLLKGTMFADFLIPGWIITGAIGISGLLCIIAIVRKVYKYHIMIIVQGIIICALVIAQMVIIGEEYMLQYLLLMMGMAIAILGGLLSQSTAYGHQQQQLKNTRK